MGDSLIKIAADIIRNLPSDLVGDYKHEPPTWVLKKFTEIREFHRLIAIRIREQYDILKEQIQQLKAERDGLKYVPGLFRCPKCNFVNVVTNLNAKDGSFSANNEPRQCANGCGPMWRITYKEELKTLSDIADDLSDKNRDLEAQLAEARDWGIGLTDANGNKIKLGDTCEWIDTEGCRYVKTITYCPYRACVCFGNKPVHEIFESGYYQPVDGRQPWPGEGFRIIESQPPNQEKRGSDEV